MTYEISSARIRRKREQIRQAKNATLMFLGFIALVVFVLGIVPYWFATVDCNTATKGLAFIERCETHPDCNLRPRELALKETYIRMQAKSCAVASGRD